jgi:hypothetical protein
VQGSVHKLVGSMYVGDLEASPSKATAISGTGTKADADFLNANQKRWIILNCSTLKQSFETIVASYQ